MSILAWFRTFVRARPGVVVLSLALWLAQSLAELAPGLIVKRFFDALQEQAFAQASQWVLLLLVFAAAGRLARVDAERARWAIRDQLLERSIRAAFAATSTIGSGLVLAVAAGAMRTGDFSVGDFALFAYYLTFLGEFSAGFGGLLLQYRQAQVSWRRIGVLSGARPRGHWSDTARPFRVVRDRTGDAGASHGGPTPPAHRGVPVSGLEPLQELRLSNLRVSRHGYLASPAGQPLRTSHRADPSATAAAVDLALRAGELVAVTGRVGSGKTTLLKASLGLVPLESGAIMWNGKVVLDPASWCRWPVCTYVPQEPHLFSVAIGENVSWSIAPTAAVLTCKTRRSPRRCRPPCWRPMSRRCRTASRPWSAPPGPRCPADSGSDSRRRGAFFHQAPLIVLDAPCSALDPATEREYLRHLRRIGG